MTPGRPLPPWPLPDEPAPIRLMNTIWADRDGVHDALSTRAELTAWMRAIGAADRRRPTSTELDRARDLRDALRRIGALLTDDPRPAAASPTADVATAVAELNAAAATHDPARLTVHDGRLERDPPPVSLSAVAAEAIALLTDPAAPPLRACLAPGCVLYFVKDHPRREWCSPACGNRVRAARHYRRHRTA